MAEAPIRTQGLSKRYRTVDALRDLDLELAQGEVLGYLGPNGAGKTTTIRLLLGLIQPTAGAAEIFGLDCRPEVSRSAPPSRVRARRGQPVARADG